MYIKTIAELAATLDVWVRHFATTKAKFLADLEKDPVNAMAWSEGMHHEGARFRLATYYLSTFKQRDEDIAEGTTVVEEQQALDNIRTHALVNAVNGALYAGSSSGTLHNLAKRYETIAWAELAALFAPIDRQIGLKVTR